MQKGSLNKDSFERHLFFLHVMNLGDTKQRGMKRNQACFQTKPKSMYKYNIFKPELYSWLAMKFWSFITLKCIYIVSWGEITSVWESFNFLFMLI